MPSLHIPVMPLEVLKVLNPKPDGLYVDMTFGAGGHSQIILNSCASCRVIAVDRDESSAIIARNIKQVYHDRFEFINAKFSEVGVLMNEQCDGVLFDVGVSSMQIDHAERGFSFMKDGPLSMTMGRNTLSAYEVVNKFSEKQLSEIILKYGDEPAAARIAKAICDNRKRQPITTTVELADIVSSVIPRTKIHAATLTFQAIRVFVNDELFELRNGLQNVIKLLKPGGVIAVITFQGLEDKVVKQVFKEYSYKEHINKYKESQSSDFYKMNILKPSYDEIKINRRARSAKLRYIVKIS